MPELVCIDAEETTLPFLQPVLARDKVRYVGEPVARDRGRGPLRRRGPDDAPGGRLRAAARGGGPRARAGARRPDPPLPVQPHRHPALQRRRRRRRPRQRPARAARALRDPALRRHADGDPRRHRLLRGAQRLHALQLHPGSQRGQDQPADRARPAGERHPRDRPRPRRRLRGQAADLPGGDPPVPHRGARQAPGQVDRGPLGALRLHHPRARAVPRRRGGLRRRRPDPRHPRRLRDQHRGLPAEPDHGRAVHRRVHAHRALPPRELRGHGQGGHDQQDADEPVPRCRPRAGRVHDGADHRQRRRRPRPRPGAGAAAQHDPTRAAAAEPQVRQRAGGDDRLRLRRLPDLPEEGGRARRPRRLRGRAGAGAGRGPLHRHGHRLLRRGDRPGAVRVRHGPGRAVRAR